MRFLCGGALVIIFMTASFHAHAQAPNLFEYLYKTTVTMVWNSVWTPQVRNVARWTGSGMLVGGLVGIGSTAGEPASFFSILYRAVVGFCTGGCVGFGVHHYRQWNDVIGHKEETIKNQEATLETVKNGALELIKITHDEVQTTQKLFEARSSTFAGKVSELDEQVKKHKQDFELQIKGIDAQVQQGAKAKDVAELHKGVEEFRGKLKKIKETQQNKFQMAQVMHKLKEQALELKKTTETTLALPKN